MGRYLEQSANAFMEMQQQLQQQTRNLFGSFPFPNFGTGTYRQGNDAKPAEPRNDDKPESGGGKG
jgi:hypothetical protein